MKVIIRKTYNNFLRYDIIKELTYTQKQYDYMFKYLDFDKLDKDWFIQFNDKEVEEWFKYVYIDEDWLNEIYNQSPEGYKWLKDNWGNGIYKLLIEYQDKQELKTIVNRVVNINLKGGKL